MLHILARARRCLWDTYEAWTAHRELARAEQAFEDALHAAAIRSTRPAGANRAAPSTGCGRRSTFRVMRDRGASAVEYGLMVAAIAAVIVGIVFGLGGLVRDAFQKTCSTIAAGDSLPATSCGSTAGTGGAASSSATTVPPAGP